MQTKRICFILTLLVLAIALASGQEKKLPQLPEFTTEQRWARAQFHIDTFLSVALGYAKSVNHTTDDVTQYCVKMFAPGWGKPDSVSPMRVLRGMRRNWLAWSDWKFELMDSLENKVMGRFNRPYIPRLFKDNASFFGISSDEYEGFLRGFNRGLCDYLHLKYEDKVEGDWVTFTISKK